MPPALPSAPIRASRLLSRGAQDFLLTRDEYRQMFDHTLYDSVCARVTEQASGAASDAALT